MTEAKIHCPVAELHCHIEGSADPALVLRLAQKYKIDLNDVICDGRYVWSDFTSFLNCYDHASMVFRQPEDYRLLAYDHYSRLAEQGAVYGEVFGSPDHAALMGIQYTELADALAAGIEDARQESGIEGRIIMTCIRHLGPVAAERVAEKTVANPHPLVTGFGIAGDERSFDISDFSDAFRLCGDAGLGLTAHAGEFAGPQSVIDALDHLEVSRIGHGVRSIEDPALVDRLVREGTVLEICPASNIALQVYPDYAAHPLRRLFHSGVRITLNSDDPPFFNTSLQQEYATAKTCFRFNSADLEQCTRTALDAAFIDPVTRTRLMNRVHNGVQAN